jgi:ABC-type phosphate transport system substrate-binding protein
MTRARLGRIIVLAAACLAAAFAASVSTASAAPRKCAVVQGAGSSLQKVAQQEVWGPNHWATKKGEEECEAVVEVKYNPTSSGKGKEQWGYETMTLGTEEPFPVFVGTDLAPSKTQIENMSKAGEEAGKLNVMSVPVAQSAVTVMVSLPEGCKPVSTEKKAEIKNAVLREEWEKGAKEFSTFMKDKLEGTCTAMPKLKARSSNSGTTAGFKRYFDTLSKEAEPWKKLNETPLKSENTEWPAELEASGNLEKCCEKGSTLAKTVFENPGTSGYADLADARHEGFTTTWAEHTVGTKKFWSAVALVESKEEFTNPEEGTGGGANCKKAKYEKEKEKVEPGVDWSATKQSNVAEKGAYSICTLTFDLTWKEYETKALVGKYGKAGEPEAKKKEETEEKRNTVLNYLKWVVSGTGGQAVKTLTEKHYGALPKEMREHAETGVKAVNIK